MPTDTYDGIFGTDKPAFDLRISTSIPTLKK